MTASDRGMRSWSRGPGTTLTRTVVAVAAGTLTFLVFAAAGSGPAAACTPVPSLSWDDLRSAERLPISSPGGEVRSVTKREHIADNGEVTASVSVALLHWGPDAPPSPAEGTLHDDTDVDEDCGFARSRAEGSIEYIANTARLGPINVVGRADEATLLRLFGQPTVIEVDATSITANIDERSGPSVAATASAVVGVGLSIVVLVLVIRRRRADGSA